MMMITRRVLLTVLYMTEKTFEELHMRLLVESRQLLDHPTRPYAKTATVLHKSCLGATFARLRSVTNVGRPKPRTKTFPVIEAGGNTRRQI